MAGGDGFGVGDGGATEFVVVGFDANEAGTRGFAEGYGEFCAGNGVHHHFVEIFGGFDEVGLAEDQVCAFRDLKRNFV